MRYINYVLALAGLGQLVLGQSPNILEGQTNTEPVNHKLVTRALRARCSSEKVFGGLFPFTLPSGSGFKREESALYADEIRNGTLSPSSELWRRVMTLPPANPDNAQMDAFMMSETAQLTETGFATRPVTGDTSTAAWVPYTSRTRHPVSAGMSGLEGCTGMLLVSRKGMYGAHYWESQVFNLDKKWLDIYDTAENAFQTLVIDALNKGDKFHRALKGEVARDIEDSSLRAYLMIPDMDEAANRDPYRDQWNRIKEEVGKIVPRLKDQALWKEVVYHPAQDDELPQGKDARGKMLVKYDPKHEEGKKKQTAWMEYAQVHNDEWE
ncbi:hypothetical protein CSOJ01_10290 [Colletotrichum sojae]|uniref:Uncharacterized protein n=1 Tax=Colletotrichum sojae TaxID=2175907 RepID=A0A8H6J1H5_9PEZI|nr:hypothetical protein CSOJ01_10290 [Colletotrichum sojae]